MALKIVQTYVKLCFHSADGIENCPDLRQLCFHSTNDVVQTRAKLCVYSTNGIENCPDLHQIVR